MPHQWWPSILMHINVPRSQRQWNPNQSLLTHWGRDKMAAIFQTIFSNAFSWMQMYKFWLRFHWRLLPGVQLTIFQHWFRLWLGAGQATSHYQNQWWLVNWHIYASLGGLYGDKPLLNLLSIGPSRTHRDLIANALEILNSCTYVQQ